MSIDQDVGEISQREDNVASDKYGVGGYGREVGHAECVSTSHTPYAGTVFCDAGFVKANQRIGRRCLPPTLPKARNHGVYGDERYQYII